MNTIQLMCGRNIIASYPASMAYPVLQVVKFVCFELAHLVLILARMLSLGVSISRSKTGSIILYSKYRLLYLEHTVQHHGVCLSDVPFAFLLAGLPATSLGRKTCHTCFHHSRPH